MRPIWIGEVTNNEKRLEKNVVRMWNLIEKFIPAHELDTGKVRIMKSQSVNP